RTRGHSRVPERLQCKAIGLISPEFRDGRCDRQLDEHVTKTVRQAVKTNRSIGANQLRKFGIGWNELGRDCSEPPYFQRGRSNLPLGCFPRRLSASTSWLGAIRDRAIPSFHLVDVSGIGLSLRKPGPGEFTDGGSSGSATSKVKIFVGGPSLSNPKISVISKLP
ncbi:hypothetical protein CCACVL1_01411, partial [Corchorus capsularis]